MYFSFSRITRTALEAQPLRLAPLRVGSAGKGTRSLLRRCAMARRLRPPANHSKVCRTVRASASSTASAVPSTSGWPAASTRPVVSTTGTER
ncbi:MAG: hypothetical protein A3I00_07760 [Betaproteobacteria bacterium RIFCSPLOWO2_02_FULL_64_12]|nr:MAG: hypothetical protein A3I00_07760 [Betaproteobacteria bacterium RIFCSPLOWO2_02_FULL_64_12]OGL14303.1 MAG: hypothetical protein A3F92_12675 [Candidatus Rokubacteria bacterium RIFCSPLOWO2_12_FULL_71_22]